MDRPLFMAGFFGATGVAAGAFGAHALGASVTPERLAVWETAAQYHLIHAVVLLVLATRTTGASPLERWVVAGFTLGVLLFSFSLYALVLTDVSRFAMITPVGGSLLMLSWLAISWHALSRKAG
ncbi:MAG: hypothetical protein CME58_10300 [Halieaceae bacterium]|nr:hypothetical protein [Halieaceae bacterium]